MRRSSLIFLLFLTLIPALQAQKLPLDSVLNLARSNVYTDPDFSEEMCEEYIRRAKPERNLVGLGKIYKFKGAMAWSRYNLKSALENFLIQGEYARKSGQPLEILSSLNNIGLVYIELESFDEALDNLYQAEQFEGNDEYNDMQSGIQTNIGLAHSRMGNDSLALVHYFRAYDLCDSAVSPVGMALILNNIGSEYIDRQEHEKAEPFLNECLPIAERSDNPYASIMAYTNLATIYVESDRTDQAIKSLNEVRRLASETGGVGDGANANFQIGKIYFENLNKQQQGLKLMIASLAVMDSIGNYDKVRGWTQELGGFYTIIGDFKNAADYYKQHIDLEDSLVDVETARIYAEMDIVNEVEKTKMDLAEMSGRHEEQKDINQRQNVINRFLIAIAIGIALFFLLVYYNYKQKKKANVLLADKNKIIEQKNREVRSSIVYAKRIQSAILPSDSNFKQGFPESFIMYKPKDIVSGDFYWMRRSGGLTFFAVGDCTGHGVPGSLVSVVCSNALERVVQVMGVRDPGKILDEVNKVVVEQFSQADEDLKDGMDIALCAIDGKNIQFSGANNPLWYFADNQLNELQADRQPIGRFEHRLNFTTKKLNLNTGDRIYMFSDGYADQFGGARTKKMTIKRFHEVLVNSCNLGITEQGEKLEEFFNQWKGEVDQIDDVCLVGIQF